MKAQMKMTTEKRNGKHVLVVCVTRLLPAISDFLMMTFFYREDVNIKEITVGDEQANVPESDEESEEGEIAEDEDMIEGEPEEEEPADGDRKRGFDEGDESSSLTPPKRKRRL